MIPEEKVKQLTQVTLLYQIWVKVKEKSGCGTPKLTPKRTKQIIKAIEQFEFDKVKSVLEFFLTDHSYAVYMRTNNYVSLDNILRPSKFAEKHALATKGFNSSFKDKSKPPPEPKEKKIQVQDGVFLPWTISDDGE